MNEYTESQRKKGLWKFIIASLIGIFLFMTPLKINGETSLPVAVLADKFKNLIGGFMPTLIYIVIILSILLTIYFSLTRNAKTSFFKNLFEVNWIWLLIRVIGGIFATIIYFNLNVPWINTEETGGLIYNGLLPTLISVFFFAGIFLPLLMDYGLFEFIGPMFSRVMRPLFTLPGRSAVENLASFVGDGTVGVMMASKQYDEGFYTRREATVIATSFSVVSITFAIVIAKKVDLMNHFFYFYFTVIVSCLVAAMITPRIWPLKQIADSYSNGSTKRLSEVTPDTHNAITYGFENAVERGIKGADVKGLLTLGSRTVMDMWFAVLPVVMCIGTLATMIAEYTPFFRWVGAPFVPILQLMNVPEAVAASETILIGFADMFLPAILIADVHSELTRFVVAALSISQLIYLSEVGGVILGSKIPVSLPKLFAIFLIRTIIILPIIVLMGHFIL
ncbi:YjiH family protein [Macrococcus equipercicus]|uniref:YjiH family protein n=1 Tax=Macrococcus equipercicus TaxID=69967 RepID=A0A9Q9BN19_9STAP|nr:YjiH family protein [Macrococcus equipercicus]KAA1037636.1 YjiH family protein [Macrococcus equipercicus]UTH14150.1 YjiH family protein [Macrococcus equipercicus]